MWGELRGLHASAESLKRFVLEPLGAQLLVVGQRQLADDDARVSFLKELMMGHLVDVLLYDKPDPRNFFGPQLFDEMFTQRGNWRNAGNLQVLINHHKLEIYLASEGLLDQYDLLLFTRSDLLHVVPFPSAAELFAALGPADVLTQAGHEFGGVNYNFSVMRSCLVSRYLHGPRAVVSSGGLKSKTYNIERLWLLVLQANNWRNLRMPITCFITADALGDRSTWKNIKISHRRGDVLFKYGPQMEEAYRSDALWQQNPTWIGLQPPRRFQVEEIHGRARRPFALRLAASETEREVGKPRQTREERLLARRPAVVSQVVGWLGCCTTYLCRLNPLSAIPS